jgi:hypothetical protein
MLRVPCSQVCVRLERPGKALYPLGPDVELKGKGMDDIADQLVAMLKRA